MFLKKMKQSKNWAENRWFFHENQWVLKRVFLKYPKLAILRFRILFKELDRVMIISKKKVLAKFGYK